jgi:hypothetical protein
LQIYQFSADGLRHCIDDLRPKSLAFGSPSNSTSQPSSTTSSARSSGRGRRSPRPLLSQRPRRRRRQRHPLRRGPQLPSHPRLATRTLVPVPDPAIAHIRVSGPAQFGFLTDDYLFATGQPYQPDWVRLIGRSWLSDLCSRVKELRRDSAIGSILTALLRYRPSIASEHLFLLSWGD